MNPVPVTVNVVGVLPACALAGATLVAVGSGFNTFNGYEFEEPPPGVGFTGFVTVICRVPAVAISVEFNEASISVEFTKPLWRLLPFTATLDCCTKFEPNTRSVKPAPPVKTPDGDREEICGTGLTVGAMLKVMACVVPPPG